jgi:two-component system, response regulator YesN
MNRQTSAKAVPEVVLGFIDVQKLIRFRPEEEEREKNDAKKKQRKNLVQEVVAYIWQMKNETLRNIKITDISQVFNVNPCYLSRKFKETCECKLCDFIQWVKVQRAVLLMQQDVLLRQLKEANRAKPLRIEVLAMYLGFSSPEYFIRCFKKWMRVSPNRYRECIKMQDLGYDLDCCCNY